MIAALRAELVKQRTTRSALGLFVAMVTLLLLVVLLHGLGLAADNFGTATKQLTILFGWSGVFGPLFAGLLGAMSVTAEIRYGTIRPTLLVNPVRREVLIAKTSASVLIGSAFGLVAGLLVAGIGSAALNSRGIAVQLGAGDYTRLLVGSALAAGMWGAVGVGVAAVVRSQVPTLVGLVVWLLFIENLLVGDIAGVGVIGRYLPGAASKAISGQKASSLLSPGVALVVLIVYAVAAAVLGSISLDRNDLA